MGESMLPSPRPKKGRQLRRPYFMIHHRPAPATAVMAMDIATDSEISFAHSQYDTHAISGRLHAAPLMLREILAAASAVCAKLRIVGSTIRPTPSHWHKLHRLETVGNFGNKWQCPGIISVSGGHRTCAKACPSVPPRGAGAFVCPACERGTEAPRPTGSDDRVLTGHYWPITCDGCFNCSATNL
jgi:hypothetical protein